MFPAALVLLVFSSLQQTPSPNPPPLRLTLKRAITIAMEGNAGVRIATEVAQQADSRVAQARAGLRADVPTDARDDRGGQALAAAARPGASPANRDTRPMSSSESEMIAASSTAGSATTTLSCCPGTSAMSAE